MNAEAMVLAAAAAIAAGLIGCFAVMRRMTLAADALSHVALPGIGIALALHIHPLFGATAALFFGALLVWALEDRGRIATETIVGVVFSAALAIGAMITSGDDLIEALFGSPGTLEWTEVAFGLTATLLVIYFVLRQKHSLVVALVSPDIARTVGIDVRRLNQVYLMAFALTVALGLRYLGVLLMGSLIIIPAATAKVLSKGLSEMLAIAVVTSVVATLGGSMAALWLRQAPGPIIVTLAAAVFIVAALAKNR
jgi:zinc transport system permease protein